MFLITQSSTYFHFIFMTTKWPRQIHDFTSVSFIYKFSFNAKVQYAIFLFHNTTIQHYSENENVLAIYAPMSISCVLYEPGGVKKDISWLLFFISFQKTLVLSFLPKTQKICVMLQKKEQVIKNWKKEPLKVDSQTHSLQFQTKP